MCQFIGQDKLINLLNNYTLSTMPHVQLFIGESGCGKHTCIKYVADKLNLKLLTIDNSVTAEDLYEFLCTTINTLFLVDLSTFNEKQQNKLLKFIEEPTNNVFIALIANSEAGILPTILNRCIKHNFEPYTKQELQLILRNTTLSNDSIYNIFKTPGKLLSLTNESFSKLDYLATTIRDNIFNYKYADLMSFITWLNFKDNYNKLDIYLFMDLLEYRLLEAIKAVNSEVYIKMYLITNQFKQYLNNKILLKENLMINFFTHLWKGINDETT